VYAPKIAPFVLSARNEKLMRLVGDESVRASRVIDLDTDKEYRKGVHWLETLRLRRTRILTSGYKVIFRQSRSSTGV
jgi:hypothetical protein